ncbi:MarR family winged helix-turn-helix transcriptional regulator [Streptantibioticus rubrisoli]|uniref:MarR family winged helix-turn-helix transcriptional regulator n=1 Tax=Streptantibioticus rubrisoli TaxID=1387313 RepID=A0ABT1P6T8_9ACTN|nr:MarR family winged helix-turn-helix transcriptional regulator [Streptantibioticus rubrisoli]MCQ4041092.1 MarR family winged helix-turn-helix transcriptional regulator [Streptantibioticus rubrisoli]
MGFGQIPGPRPEESAERISGAVQELVAVWSNAFHHAAPRVSTLQLRALEAVEHQHKPNLTGLATELEIGMPTASRLCDRLEAAGFLERSVQPRNRREVLLAVTRQGRRLLDDVAARRRRSLAAVLTAMDPDDRAALVRALQAFLAASATARARGTRGAGND